MRNIYANFHVTTRNLNSLVTRVSMPLRANHNLPPFSSSQRTQKMSTATPDVATETSPRKLKILMLHGYTQSGPSFHAKTKALEKALAKAFPSLPPSPHKPLPGTLIDYPGGVELIYPTAPLRLRPSDIPGFVPREDATDEIESFAWWRRDDGTGEYTGIQQGFGVMAEAIKQAGGIDGVIGFSQGGAAAGMVASLLEDGRSQAFDKVAGLEYPKSFLPSADGNPISSPLKFGVVYSGFKAPQESYKGFYEPQLSTPILHVIGTLDSVVDESRSLSLVDVCRGGREKIAYHTGGHFVPIGKDMVGCLIGFIRDTCGEKKAAEESVEDMDVPF